MRKHLWIIGPLLVPLAWAIQLAMAERVEVGLGAMLYDAGWYQLAGFAIKMGLF